MTKTFGYGGRLHQHGIAVRLGYKPRWRTRLRAWMKNRITSLHPHQGD